MTKDKQLPFVYSYWVVPGRLLAGHFPGSPDPAKEEEKLHELLDCGIRCVINLMEADEVNHLGESFTPYWERLEDIAGRIGTAVRWMRYPIEDFNVPHRETLVQILDEVDKALAEGLPVYVHCWGGIGRTGTVVGAYMARHDIALGQKAIDRIRKLRRRVPSKHIQSPEAEVQRRMVRSWMVGE